jgi:hypothetical protein
MPTYHVTCKNLINHPAIAINFDIEPQYLTDVLAITESTFASVDVTDNETGEVIAIRYTTYDLHPQLMTIGEALMQLNDYIIKPEV